MSDEQPQFSVLTPSRHPAPQHGYDGAAHHYRPEYVRPDSWALLLSYPARRTLLPLAGLPLAGLPLVGFPLAGLPPGVESVRWTITQEGGAFTATRLQRAGPGPIGAARVDVPGPGTYRIHLTVRMTDGTDRAAERSYRLRDFLVVSVGDSFAAGQGNPDVAAVASPDQRAMCTATTVSLLLDAGQKLLSDFLRAAEDDGAAVIETYLPYAGKIVVAGLSGVRDVRGFISGQVRSLAGFAVDVARDIGGAVVEGAKEVGSWFGVGDGGDADAVLARPALWQEPAAYRSYRSGHSLAARQIEADGHGGADRVTFLSFARTGSEIHDGLLGPRTIRPAVGAERPIDGWVGNIGQIEEARRTVAGRRIDALIVTIGINDLGFSSLVSDSIVTRSGEKRAERMRITEAYIGERLPADLGTLKAEIDRQLNPRRVFLVEYPVGVFRDLALGTERPCGILTSKVGLDLDRSDAKGLDRLGRLLNDKLRDVAHTFGWTLVSGVEAGFDHHGYCAAKPYFVSAEESCRNQGDFEGMLHPNQRGHAVARDRIAAALRQQLTAPATEWLIPVLAASAPTPKP